MRRHLFDDKQFFRYCSDAALQCVKSLNSYVIELWFRGSYLVQIYRSYAASKQQQFKNNQTQ